MKTNSCKKLVPVALISGLLLTLSAHADPLIDGTIRFSGNAELNGSFNTATAFSSFTGPDGNGTPVVLTDTGDFSMISPGTSAAFELFAFSPHASWKWPRSTPLTVPNLPFWTLTSGSVVAGFDITSITITTQTSHLLRLDGSGILQLTGHADTMGTWSIIDTKGDCPNLCMQFQTTPQHVPEPAPAALVAAGFVIVLLYRTYHFRNSRAGKPRVAAF